MQRIFLVHRAYYSPQFSIPTIPRCNPKAMIVLKSNKLHPCWADFEKEVTQIRNTSSLLLHMQAYEPIEMKNSLD